MWRGLVYGLRATAVQRWSERDDERPYLCSGGCGYRRGQCAGRTDQTRSQAHGAVGQHVGAGRVRCAVRSEGGGIQRPDPCGGDRWGGHQAAHRDRYRECGHDRHRPCGDVRERSGLSGRGAAAFSGLFCHRKAGRGSGHAHHRRHRHGMRGIGLRADRGRDGGNAGDVSQGRFRSCRVRRGRDGAGI